MSSEFLKVENLVKNFPLQGGLFSKEIATVKAVQDVSFSLKKGQTLGLVGESGCGKSTLGKCLVRLQQPTSGKIEFLGKDITHLHGKELQALRRKIQIIFQDPFASLNPRMTIDSILEEPLIIHKIGKSKATRKERICELAGLVGIQPEHLTRFPHELSGGQRQRVGIARALAVEPELIICDEPVSALDVSIQAQVINLLMDLQKKLNLSYIFIAHDLKIVEHVSNTVGVMYLGKIVELASADEIYLNPKHPYTRALMSAIPIPDPKPRAQRTILTGEVPSPIRPPTGCQFHTRCPLAKDECKTKVPSLELKSHDHLVSCIQV